MHKMISFLLSFVMSAKEQSGRCKNVGKRRNLRFNQFSISEWHSKQNYFCKPVWTDEMAGVGRVRSVHCTQLFPLFSPNQWQLFITLE